MSETVLTVTDYRDMKWELFCDTGYFDMWCVRPATEHKFNSILNFHFLEKEEAEKFIRLLEIAS